MLKIKTILHPTDFSEASEAAFHLACSLARDHGSRLILLHVIAPPAVAYTEGGMLPPTEEVREQLWAQLDAVEAGDDDVVLERDLVEGDPAAEILRLAKEIDSDLIVMGCHGRTGLSRLLMGSVAEEVVRKGSCPVLTVKVPMTHLTEEPGTETLTEAVVQGNA